MLELRRKRCIKQQQELLPKFEEKPELLVQKRVLHKFVEEGTTEPEWFKAKVVVIILKNVKYPLKSNCVIKYDEEDDDTSWQFLILADFKKGDLILEEMF